MFPKDRSTFNKFLIYSPWDEKELNKIRKIDSLNKMKEAMDDKIPCFFSIHDTILSKNSSSKKIEGLSFNYSHVSGKSEWSHCLIALHGHSNSLSLPLDFKPYLSKEYFVQQKDRVFKNKLELALNTLVGVDLDRFSIFSFFSSDSNFGVPTNEYLFPDCLIGCHVFLTEYKYLPVPKTLSNLFCIALTCT